MTEFVRNDIVDSWREAVRHVMAWGQPAQDDKGKILEVSPLRLVGPALNPGHGDDLPEQLASLLPLYQKKFFENDVVEPFQYSYGQQIFSSGQFEKVLTLLQEYPESKSAWVRFSSVGVTVRPSPCLLAIGFAIRNGQINGYSVFRSQNMHKAILNYLPLINLVGLAAEHLKVDTGVLDVTVIAPHIYEGDLLSCKQIADPSYSKK